MAQRKPATIKLYEDGRFSQEMRPVFCTSKWQGDSVLGFRDSQNGSRTEQHRRNQPGSKANFANPHFVQDHQTELETPVLSLSEFNGAVRRG